MSGESSEVVLPAAVAGGSGTTVSESSLSTHVTSVRRATDIVQSDIGKLSIAQVRKLLDGDKRWLLKNCCRPAADFKYPSRRLSTGNRGRFSKLSLTSILAAVNAHYTKEEAIVILKIARKKRVHITTRKPPLEIPGYAPEYML